MRRRRKKRRSERVTRYRFTRADCRKGYQAALEKCMQDWERYAWFFRKVRGFYKHKKGAT